MYKNQLQELAQRSCFGLPSYTYIREGPDHAPRFRASVNFNGEFFESPAFCSTLRQAEHAAAEVALSSLSHRGPSHSLAARILDETGVYKNLLQEISRRVGAPLPSYTTTRSGFGHQPVFRCNVELAGITFTGGQAKNKKQAEKNAAMEAWNLLKKVAKETVSSSSEPENNDEQEQVTIARALLNYRLKEKVAIANHSHDTPFLKKFPQQSEKKPTFMQKTPLTGSRILPLIQPKLATKTDGTAPSSSSILPSENRAQPHKSPAAGALHYVPIRYHGVPYHTTAPPVTIRNSVPVFSAPPHPPTQMQQLSAVAMPPFQMALPVHVRPVVPVFAALPLNQSVPPAIPFHIKEQPSAAIATPKASPAASIQMKEALPVIPPVVAKEPLSAQFSLALNELKELEI